MSIKVFGSEQTGAVDVETEVIDGKHIPIYKGAFGKKGVFTLISEDNPQPITASNADINRSASMLDAINGLVVQMKINNAYQALIWDDEITEEDIE